MSIIQPGNQRELRAEFTDKYGDPYTPDEVYLTIKSPDNVIHKFQYGVDDLIELEDVGKYKAICYFDMQGTWSYRWFCLGAGKASAEREIVVEYVTIDG